MKCFCEIVIDQDFDSPSLFKIKRQVARKAHKCTECRRTILPKEKYERIEGIWDGSWHHFKMCNDCLSIKEVMFTEGFEYGSLWEYFNNTFDNHSLSEIPESCLASLTPRARNKICDLIEASWKKSK